MADTAVVVSTQLNVQGFYTDPWFSVHLLVSLAQVSAGKQRDLLFLTVYCPKRTLPAA